MSVAAVDDSFVRSWQVYCSQRQARCHDDSIEISGEATCCVLGYFRQIYEAGCDRLCPVEIIDLVLLYYFVPKQWAKKGDWKIVNFPSESSKYIVHKCDIQYSKKQLSKIRVGSIPREMEDKWFIFEDPSTQNMNLHRSWTGMSVYQCSIKNLKYNDKHQVILRICEIRQNKEYQSFLRYTPINLFILLLHWMLHAGKPLNMTDDEWTRIQQK
eukprot:1018502_1